MAVRDIRRGNDSALRKKCRPVKEVDERVRALLDDLLDTLHSQESGAGLAANQVGLLKRLVVIDMDNRLLKLVNPKLVAASGSQDCVEGCLSFPGLVGRTIRPMNVIVQALDENGKKITVEGHGDMAKCLCHELDHLDGIVFTKRITQILNDKMEGTHHDV